MSASPTPAKPLLLTFDVEEFDWPSELGRPLAVDEQIDVTARGVASLLPRLDAAGVRATFFITGRFARARPDLVRAIARERHELAAHGLEHHDDYANMDRTLATERLDLARAILEDLGGVAVGGVRLPRLRACAMDVLRRAGFRYDATAHPTWVPGRYWGLHWPRAPWSEDGIIRVPISVLPGVRLPVSWIWYRAAGPHLGGLAVRAAALGAPYLHLYFHPWEAIEIGRLGIPPWLALRSGPPFLAALEHLLAWGSAHLRPMTVGEYVAHILLLTGTSTRPGRCESEALRSAPP